MFTEYLEAGIAAIPVRGKIPMVKGWQAFSAELPSAAQAEEWDDLEGVGVGVVCGAASNLIAVDIDTDDPDILEVFKKHLPPTPIAKRGSKGVTYFYCYSPELRESRAVSVNGRHLFDLISNLKQTVIPPSVHPDTKKPYQWTTPFDLLSELPPKIKAADLNAVIRELQPTVAPLSPEEKTAIGRNNRLKEIASAMIHRHEDMSDVVQELIRYDREHHNPPLFTDKTEFKTGSEFANAALFYANLVGSISKTHDVSPISVLETDSEIAEAPHTEQVKYPTPAGIMGEFMNYIMSTAHMPNHTLALGSSIAMMATLACNRYRLDQTWPNVYVLNVAPSASGKDRPQRACIDLFDHIGMEDLLGYGAYTSDAALLQGLTDSTNVRLDIMDECGGLLKQANDPNGSSWQYRMSDIWAELWSASSSRYLGRVSAGNGAIGRCEHPCVNILGSTTPAGFRQGISKDCFEKGFLSRFLVFRTNERNRPVRMDRSLMVPPRLADAARDLAGVNPTSGNIGKPEAINVRRSDSFVTALADLEMAYFDKVVVTDEEHITTPIVKRCAQQVAKLALIHGVSRNPLDPKVDIQDLRFGENVVELFLRDMEEFLPLNTGGDDKTLEILRVIQSSGKDGIKHTDLFKRVRTRFAGELGKRVKELMELGYVCEKTSPLKRKQGGGRQPKVYYPLKT